MLNKGDMVRIKSWGNHYSLFEEVAKKLGLAKWYQYQNPEYNRDPYYEYDERNDSDPNVYRVVATTTLVDEGRTKEYVGLERMSDRIQYVFGNTDSNFEKVNGFSLPDDLFEVTI